MEQNEIAKSTEEIIPEKEMIKSAVGVSRVMADAMEKYDKQNKRLWTALIACIVALALMTGVVVYAILHGQEILTKSLENALSNIAEIGVTETTTTTTTVTQDTGEGTGNNVYLQENGTYNESGDK